MKKLSLVFLGILLTASACGPYRAGREQDSIHEKERVLLMDSVLARNLKVVKEASSKTDAGNYQIKLDIENEKNKDLWCDVQVIFRDKEGFELEKTGWEPVQFHRRAVTSIQRNSLNSKAEDYRVLIRNTE